MEKWIGKVAIVTGASSGIGEEICKKLVEKGMIVVGFARREDRLQELQKKIKKNFYYVKVDLCSEENILEAFRWVKSTLKSVDILINNAGVYKMSGLFGKTEDWRAMIDTNVIGLNICSREAVNIMKELKINGHIININSVLGHSIVPIKNVEVYSSTKYSVTAITEYLRGLMSLKNLPIRVTSVSPGLVLTEMSDQFGLGKLDENGALLPIDIADAVLYALGAPQRVNISEITVRPSYERFDMLN